jgi:hypothetical protein
MARVQETCTACRKIINKERSKEHGRKARALKKSKKVMT